MLTDGQKMKKPWQHVEVYILVHNIKLLSSAFTCLETSSFKNIFDPINFIVVSPQIKR